jgi:hypothetical protein
MPKVHGLQAGAEATVHRWRHIGHVLDTSQRRKANLLKRLEELARPRGIEPLFPP